MLISGWGNYPKVDADVYTIEKIQDLISYIQNNNDFITQGNARSYGDSALNKNIISTLKLNRFLDFDTENGIITAQAGVLFSDILKIAVPKGWFLPVTPGTKYVTLGGAMASDVHGKNHHKHGTLGQYIESFDILLADGEIRHCSKVENTELYHSAIAGMGLLGIILSASLKLIKIETPYIKQKVIKTRSLEELYELFEINRNYTYSVSWIDITGGAKSKVNGLLMLGEHALSSEVKSNKQKPDVIAGNLLNIPIYFPNFVLNHSTIKIFNALYYGKELHHEKNAITYFDSYFYPLDIVNNWNKVYGNRGFLQYQFVVPLASGLQSIKKILNKIDEYGQASFLTVLKTFGKRNDFVLSFPDEGYTLAMDFPFTRRLPEMFNELDKIVLDYGGRFYLTKDAHLSPETFHHSNPEIDKFLEIKAKYDPNNKFQSLQSKRLGF
ncbi:MAG TPA: FAD-binding oxidoreductase [Bacteroidota bacterium]|nr:FAD-binding oxidoreductase [Bacteroidota bacterium]HRT67644.1 FAD-binding oxidoreductase [Bacteroidota bacterium]